MVDATRALLDQLMGKDRNLTSDEKPRKIKWSDESVCQVSMHMHIHIHTYIRTHAHTHAQRTLEGAVSMHQRGWTILRCMYP